MYIYVFLCVCVCGSQVRVELGRCISNPVCVSGRVCAINYLVCAIQDDDRETREKESSGVEWGF